MFNFTLQHVLVMRLLMQYPLKTTQNIYNVFYLVAAENNEPNEIGFYDFIRLNTGPYSPILNSILEELIINQLLNRKDMELTPKGREIYYNLGSALRGFENFVNTCSQLVDRYTNDISKINKAIKTNFIFRKTPIGKQVFPVKN